MNEKRGAKSQYPAKGVAKKTNLQLEKRHHDIAIRLGNGPKVVGVRIALDEAAEKRGWK